MFSEKNEKLLCSELGHRIFDVYPKKYYRFCGLAKELLKLLRQTPLL